MKTVRKLAGVNAKQARAASPDSSLSKDLQAQVQEIMRSTRVVECVRKVIAAITHELTLCRKENEELRGELEILRSNIPAEPDSVETQPEMVADSQCPPPSSPPVLNLPYHEVERLRSVVISGIPELNSPRTKDRVNYDCECVCKILDYLNIECDPVSVYRLGRPQRGMNRLTKVVLPARMFQRLAVKRAPRLRFFCERGIYLRPSLTLEERKRRKEERNQQAPASQNRSSYAPQQHISTTDMTFTLSRKRG
ncbi:hypothetical protein ANCDUO_01239 [Ancylostoma duodenale]|uniref:Uncharacterized protein n=1 Tax=Ancylostoma duodenale TaxID=51022 RepID=A0A0C2HFR6_9BILA|nr:hypothetical protein ANCDUO_01239 [Ancylostoma duodenale]